jgi:hypothetical protein
LFVARQDQDDFGPVSVGRGPVGASDGDSAAMRLDDAARDRHSGKKSCGAFLRFGDRWVSLERDSLISPGSF